MNKIMDGLMGMVPGGMGTYSTIMVGLVMGWAMVWFPGAGAVFGFEGGLAADQMWTATWVAVGGAFGRRAIGSK